MTQAASTAEAEAVFAARRHAMVAEVAEMAQEVSPFSGGGPAISRAVLDALERVPRHRFVPPEEIPFAYHNRPLSIGHGQTISQPYIVALMTDLLALEPGARVLEVGTGCGYQAAVLAELGLEVYTLEIVGPLAEHAAQTLKALGYARVHAGVGDGSGGWPEHAPFDGVIVTAGAQHVPRPLIDQLKPGGRLVIPVGASFSAQELLLITKDAQGETHTRDVLPVRFVPLIGSH